MKEISICEEYVLRELEEKKEQLKRLAEASRNCIEVMDDVNSFLDIMKKHLNLHKAADEKKIITMEYISEEYDPEEFKLLKDLFHLEVKGESNE